MAKARRRYTHTTHAWVAWGADIDENGKATRGQVYAICDCGARDTFTPERWNAWVDGCNASRERDEQRAADDRERARAIAEGRQAQASALHASRRALAGATGEDAGQVALRRTASTRGARAGTQAPQLEPPPRQVSPAAARPLTETQRSALTRARQQWASARVVRGDTSNG